MLLCVAAPFGCVPTATADPLVFTLSQQPHPNALFLFKNGNFLTPVTGDTPYGDYELLGTRITLVNVLEEEDRLYAQGIC